MGVQIGIDVGYSAARRSCAIALSLPAGLQLPVWPDGGTSLPTLSGCLIRCVKVPLERLVALLPQIIASIDHESVTVVLDGPLGPNGPPVTQRHVDRECQRGQFYCRAVPASVTGGGAGLVTATYRIARALVGADAGPCYQFAPNRLSSGPRVQLFETMPTVGMAALLQSIPSLTTIPSRNRPIAGIRQKSDYYWLRGAHQFVAVALGCEAAAGEGDHDRRAALYCLAVAMQIDGATNHGAPVCIGEPQSGVYVLLGPEDHTWSEALDKVRRVHRG